MPKSAKSARSSPPSKGRNSVKSSVKPAVRKSSPLGRRLIAGLKEALAHARGELDLPGYTVMVPDEVDVAKVRHALGLSQSAFARAFGLDVTAIHAWEQGRRRPDRTARILLAVIAKEPEAVRRALATVP
jgi:putative transcriptional regulator